MTWSSIRRRAGMGLATALWLVALLPAYWATGGTWGLMEAMGDPEPFRPPAVLMGAAALLLVGWMTIVLGAMGTWGGNAARRFCRWGCCVMAVALLAVASGFLFHSRNPWEQMLFGPSVLLLALAAAALVLDEARAPRLLPW